MTRKVLMGAALALLVGGRAYADHDDDWRKHQKHEWREHEEREHGWQRDDPRWRYNVEPVQPDPYYYNRDYRERNVPQDQQLPQDSD
jgi:hypothetical protein